MFSKITLNIVFIGKYIVIISEYKCITFLNYQIPKTCSNLILFFDKKEKKRKFTI